MAATAHLSVGRVPPRPQPLDSVDARAHSVLAAACGRPWVSLVRDDRVDRAADAVPDPVDRGGVPPGRRGDRGVLLRVRARLRDGIVRWRVRHGALRPPDGAHRGGGLARGRPHVAWGRPRLDPVPPCRIARGAGCGGARRRDERAHPRPVPDGPWPRDEPAPPVLQPGRLDRAAHRRPPGRRRDRLVRPLRRLRRRRTPCRGRVQPGRDAGRPRRRPRPHDRRGRRLATAHPVEPGGTADPALDRDRVLRGVRGGGLELARALP